mmetsp:Transcript_26940/g.43093  ORF Transcript_26940/g.43093 Transcript_26940/m.43093 type:complete len:150 (-) Transcript_26940:111-560(-)
MQFTLLFSIWVLVPCYSKPVNFVRRAKPSTISQDAIDGSSEHSGWNSIPKSKHDLLLQSTENTAILASVVKCTDYSKNGVDAISSKDSCITACTIAEGLMEGSYKEAGECQCKVSSSSSDYRTICSNSAKWPAALSVPVILLALLSFVS